MAVVEIMRSRTSRDPLAMHLLRCLALYAAYYQFNFHAEHLPGMQNAAADAISRNNLPMFFSLLPQMPQVIIPHAVTTLLVTTRPDWGSQNWTTAFRSSLMLASHNQLMQRMKDNFLNVMIIIMHIE